MFYVVKHSKASLLCATCLAMQPAFLFSVCIARTQTYINLCNNLHILFLLRVRHGAMCDVQTRLCLYASIALYITKAY